MSTDVMRDLQKIGRNLNNIDPEDIGDSHVPERSCFIVACPRNLLDQSAGYDAMKAAKMFIRADFKLFFLFNPEYPQFWKWTNFFLKNTTDYLAIVLTGFPMIAPDGGPSIGLPFKIKDREVLPSKIFKFVKENKHPANRLTLLINGCGAAETWSNGGDEVQKLSFTTTSTTYRPPMVKQFSGDVPERVLLMTSCPRLDTNMQDRNPNGSSEFLTRLSHIAKADPVLNASEILDKIGPELRKCGEEVVAFASSLDIDTGAPFLY